MKSLYGSLCDCPLNTQRGRGKDLAAHLQVEIEAQLTKEEIEAAQLCVGSQSLDEIVRQFLAGG